MIPFLLIALTTISLAMAFHFWQRCKNLSAVLREGAKGYEELRIKNNRMERSITGFENQIAELRRSDDQSRRNLTHVSTNAAKAEQAHAERTRDLERKLRNVELQRDHMIHAHEALQSKYNDVVTKVDELTSAKEAWSIERHSLLKNLDDIGSQTIVKLKADLEMQRRSNQEMERELKQLKSRDVINPRDFDTLKRRANHYESLYAGMKGLRDMVDERNKNWEDALQKMSRWILTSSPVAVPNDPVLNRGIGPIVGEALERIGATLVEIESNTHLEDREQALHPQLEQRAGAQSEIQDNISQ